ncbi:unnamed protein product [marine sediment metagenome]|uniref:Uncharacterized protein n=1 Tax=marine sediment metagenome TaxID=412755 RepID=X0ZJH7_9ZZZZ
MTDLDDICTFLEKVHTVATAEHWPDVGNVDDIIDETYQKIFVNTPEIIGTNGSFITKRYKVEISETGEATNLIPLISPAVEGGGLDLFRKCFRLSIRSPDRLGIWGISIHSSVSKIVSSKDSLSAS